MTDYKTIDFDLDNGRGQILSAFIEMPAQDAPKAFAIFANCFTCEKEFFAPKRISRGLATRGIACVRFDFMGLGKSGGDFSDSNFTTNIQDMHAIANKIHHDFGAYPEILLGHSFGGCAAFGLSTQLESIKMIATIGAPKDPRHVMRHFEEHGELSKENGQIEISVAGRPYILKSQFIQDLKTHDIETATRNFKGSLLTFHDPQDNIVQYQNALELFNRGGGENILINMDGAGHMMGDLKHTSYIAETIANKFLHGLDPTGEHIKLK